MELRVLQYFLAVAKNENITKAAEKLHLTQPTLSRQLAELEEELGAQLFWRGKRKMQLTEAGLLFKERAEEIIALADKTRAEFQNADKIIAGDIYIGCGETEAMRDVASVLAKLHIAYPNVRVHLLSGNEELVIDRLEKGLLDFGMLCRAASPAEYAYLKLPYEDRWGLVLRADNPLAQKDFITREDLAHEQLIVSRQAMENSELDHWLGKSLRELNITATYNLFYNAAFFAEQGWGSVLCFAGLEKMCAQDNLVFRELVPTLKSSNYLVWRRGQSLARAARLVQECFRAEFGGAQIK